MSEPEKDPLAAELGRRGGIKGGRARAESLPPELRRAIAQRAAATRWAKVGAKSEQPKLPGTLRAEALATLVLDGRPIQVIRTDAGARLVGQLSVEAIIGEPLPPGASSVPYHVPGEWQLKRGLTPESFLGLLTERALAGQNEAVRLLGACALFGLAPLIERAFAGQDSA